MYDYENSREAAGLENIGWKLNPHKRVMLQLNDEDLELKKNDIYKKLLSNLGHYEWEEWTSRMLAAAIQNAKAIGAKLVEITSNVAWLAGIRSLNMSRILRTLSGSSKNVFSRLFLRMIRNFEWSSKTPNLKKGFLHIFVQEVFFCSI